MLILSFDTSMPVFSVALTRDGALVAATSAQSAGSRNEKLLPAVEWLLAESGVERGALERVVVTRGPGSFTGVRIGLATAQGLAFSLDIPVTALSTHEAALGGISDRDALVWSDAGRGEVYVSGFRSGEEALAPTLMHRDGLGVMLSEWSEGIDVDALSTEGNLALLAARRIAALASRDALDRYADATPLYVRLAEAEARLLGKAHE